MKRQIAAVTIAVVAAFGLAACSSSPAAEDKSDTSTSQSESSAPKEETTSDQSVADACVDVSAKISAATSELSSIDYAAADPQATVDQFTTTVDAIGTAVDEVSNADVKEAVTAVHEDFVTLRDLLSRVVVDQDMSAASELSTVTADMQESAQAFTTLCAAG